MEFEWKEQSKEKLPKLQTQLSNKLGKSTEPWTYFKLHCSGDGDVLTLLIASFADCAFPLLRVSVSVRSAEIFVLQMQGYNSIYVNY